MTTTSPIRPTVTLASLSARVADLMQLERAAFRRLYDLEALSDEAPPCPPVDGLSDDQRQVVMEAWWRALDEFERRTGIASASRVWDRVVLRLGRAVDALAEHRPADAGELFAKARVAALVRAEHQRADCVARLDAALATDLQAVAAAA